MTAFRELLDGLIDGASWDRIGDHEAVRDLLHRVYDERAHSASHHRERYMERVNLPKSREGAMYAGLITSEGNEQSGPYQGTSFVWFPGEGGSVVVLVIGTDGFGADTPILGRPGHARRLRALSRLHDGQTWVKPDLLDLSSEVPESVVRSWPPIEAALRAYTRFIYAATAVRSPDDAQRVEDILDLFLFEHGTPLTGAAARRWDGRQLDLLARIFPSVKADDVAALLRERRFVILEGPPGTGKTRLALEVGRAVGSHDFIQFHPARTYEDFVVGLFPRPSGDGLGFEVRPGDLLRANRQALDNEHVLIIDEVNRADLGRVLGEAVTLFEVGESDRQVRLPYTPEGSDDAFQLAPELLVLGTRNTADRAIARIDLAIRRRFAFVEVWPSLQVVEDSGAPEFAIRVFEDVVHTFTELVDDDGLRLIPGHAYFLDPRPDLGEAGRDERIARRLHLELVPLLRDYVDEKLLGPATTDIAGLADRIEALVPRGA